MNKSQIIALYNRDQRIEVEYPDTRREALPHLVRHIGNKTNGEGTILYSRLDETNVEDAIRDQVAYFESIGQDFEWKVHDYDLPPDLRDRLVAHGFEIEEVEAIMVLDLANAPEILLRPPPNYIQQITSPQRIADVLAVEEQVWETKFSWLGEYLAQTIEITLSR